jgi:hypothetical protein
MCAHLFWGNLYFQENAEYASLLGPNVVLLFLYSSFVLCCSSTNVLVFITFLCFIKAIKQRCHLSLGLCYFF